MWRSSLAARLLVLGDRGEFLFMFIIWIRVVDVRHLRFDPRLNSGIEIGRLHTGGIYRRADTDGYRAGLFDECVPAPETSRVMRHRYHRRTGMRGKPRAAYAVSAFFAGGYACPLRENHYAEPLLKPVFPLFDDLFQRCFF